MTIQLARRLFTVDEYERMVEAGILGEDDRVELLDGEIVEMSPIGSRHAACVNRLNRLLARVVGNQAIVSIQNPIRLGRRSELQPDLALLQPRADFYAQAHPEPEDVLLVIEVADTTQTIDRERKLPLYAKAGIVQVWLVDLAAEVIDDYRMPGAAGYRLRERFVVGDVLRIAALPEALVAVADVVG
jgi:Uma2 family endonuclease